MTHSYVTPYDDDDDRCYVTPQFDSYGHWSHHTVKGLYCDIAMSHHLAILPMFIHSPCNCMEVMITTCEYHQIIMGIECAVCSVYVMYIVCFICRGWLCAADCCQQNNFRFTIIINIELL